MLVTAPAYLWLVLSIYTELAPEVDSVPLSMQTVIGVVVSIVSLMFGGGWLGNYLINRLQLRSNERDRTVETLGRFGERQHEELLRLDRKIEHMNEVIIKSTKEIMSLNMQVVQQQKEIGVLEVKLENAVEELAETKEEARRAKEQTDECDKHRINCEKRLQILENKMWYLPELEEDSKP